MADEVTSADLPLTDSQGRQIGSLRLVPLRGKLFRLTPSEARRRSEEEIQVVEGGIYEYALTADNPQAHLDDSDVIQPSRIANGTGRFEPGLATGLLPLVVRDSLGQEFSRATVEVRSAKIDYLTQYRTMLDDIASKSTGLLMDIRAPSRARMSPDPRVTFETTHQRFAFIRFLITSREFRDAIQQIMVMPHRLLESENFEQDIRRGFKPSGRTLRQFGTVNRDCDSLRTIRFTLGWKALA